MKFNWKNFRLLADDLRTLHCAGGVEARLRASISRGYYGVFHLVRHVLEQEGASFKGRVDIHQEVVQQLLTNPDPRRQKIGSILGKLRQYRNLADYQDEINNVAQLENLSLISREALLSYLAAA